MINTFVLGRNRLPGLGLLALAAVGLFAGPASAQTAYTWLNPADGTWQVGPWNPAGTPGAADSATINVAGTYAVTSTAAISVATVNIGTAGATLNTSTQSFTVGTALNLTAGTLITSGATSAAAGWTTSSGTNWNWTAGTLGGAGTYTNGGTMTIGLAGGAPNLTSALVNSGTINWNGPGSIFTQTGASFNNSGLFDIRADGTVIQNTLFNATFTNTNTGTIRKSIGAGTSTIQAALTSTGTIEALAGTLAFAGGATVSGTVSAAAGATVALQGDTITGTLTGAGAGTITIGDGTTIAAAGATLNYAGSRLQWTNGGLTGPGTLTIPSGATLNISQAGSKAFNSPFVNAGTVINTGAGVTNMNPGSSIANSGLYDVRYDTGGVFLPNGGGALTNTGIVRKSVGAGTSALNVNFVNAAGGTISVQTGTMTIGSGGANPTSFTFNGASNLEITGGNTANTVLNLPNVVTQGAGAVLTIKVMNDGTLITSGTQVYNWTVITGAAGGTNVNSLPLSAFAVAGGNVPIINASVIYSGNNVVIQFTPVPEPAGMLLFGGVFAAGVAAVRRRRAV